MEPNYVSTVLTIPSEELSAPCVLTWEYISWLKPCAHMTQSNVTALQPNAVFTQQSQPARSSRTQKVILVILLPKVVESSNCINNPQLEVKLQMVKESVWVLLITDYLLTRLHVC